MIPRLLDLPTRLRLPRLAIGLFLAAGFAALRPVASAAPPQNSPVVVEEAPADAERPAKRKPEAANNPLADLIRRVFNRGGPIFPPRRPPGARLARPRPGDGNPEGEEDHRRTNPSDRDYIDSRAPHDAKIEHQLRMAQAAVRKKDWTQAVKLLQQLLDLPEDSLHRLPDGRWQSIRVTACRELGAAPPAVLASYQQQNGGLAKQLLADALAEGDVAGVIGVATRFFHTDAGYDAADFLATVHYDRAEFGVACQWLDQLLATRAVFLQSPVWRLKAAAMLHHAGRDADANRLLAGQAADGSPLVLNGVTINPREWLDHLPARAAPAITAAPNWPQIFGNSARNGLQAGSPPFLMAQWHVPYTSSHVVRQRVEWMLQELGDQNRPIHLAAQPLAIAGKGVYRDLRGVRVVDLETGATVWETAEGISAERIASGTTQDAEPDRAGDQILDNTVDAFGGQPAENHPLLNLMLRDGSYNTISSDGRQVFLIEDQGILSRQHQSYWNVEESDPYGFTWTSNRLSSYDLESGRPLWTVGGPETTESFQLPLAGVYFFGAPTPDGDDLFAIGSQGDEVRLWCLDRRTGGLRWSQLIGYSDTKIDQDIARRWMAALPSVSDGIVVCPTNIGWLVGVDRLRQSVLWAVRYSPPAQGQDYSMGTNVAQFYELGGQWGPSAPAIVNQRVLFTPAEDQLLICVDLVTGAKCWEIPRETGLYLAGVSQDRAVVVSHHQVAAHDLQSGKTLWDVSIGEQDLPSGRAAVTADQVFLPLNSGELRVLELADGRTSLRTFVPSGQPPLGNLVLHEGRVLSLGPQGLSGFRQQAALLEEISQRKKQNPLDPRALINEAEILLLNRDASQAVAVLRQIETEALTSELQARLHADQVAGLTAVIRQDLANSEQPLAELARLGASPAERLLHLDLSAERHLALGEHVPAFDLYWRLTAEPTRDFVTRTDDAKILVDRQAWLGGRLRDVWTAARGEARAALDAKIGETLSPSANRDDSPQQRAQSLLQFHPSIRPLIRQSIEGRLKAGDMARLELDLLFLANSPEPGTAAWATWKLGELMEQQQLPADASHFYRRLESNWGAVVLPDGRTATDVVREIRQSGRVPVDPSNSTVAWDDRALKMTQLPYVYNQPNQELVIESPLPYFDAWNLEYLPQQQRLSFEPRSSHAGRWLAPLRSSASNRHGGLVMSEDLGHFLVLVHHDVLHLISPVRRETVWSLPLDSLADGGLPPAYGNRQPLAPMWSVQQSHGLPMPFLPQDDANNRLAVVQPNYLAVKGRRAVHLLDSRTGQEVWRRTHVQPQTAVLGGPELLFLIPPDMQDAVAYRVSDGTPVSLANLDQLLAKTLGLAGDDLLLVESGAGIKILNLDRTKTVIRRHNPLTQADVWKEEFGAGAMISRLSDDELFVVPASGAAELVQIDSGKRQALEPLTSKDLMSRSECFALADDECIYLLVNSNAGGYHHFAESLPSVRAHGTMFAWQRSTGKLLWKQTLNNQHLIVDRLRGSPVLVFCAREWKQRGAINFSELSLLLVHKATGKVLHESSTPTMYNGFHSLAIFPAEQTVELRSYNLRVRLSPADKPDAAPKAKGSN